MLILDLLYFLLLLLCWPFWLKYVLKKSYRPLLRSRLRPQVDADADAATEKAVWIHAVSVGEVRSLRSLIETLARGGQRIVLSVTTPAGFEFARREYPGLAVILSPLDLSFVVRRFIDRIRPRLVIFNELEVWPNWIQLLHRRRIPMLLINGRISEAAFRRYRVFGFILRPFFRRIDRSLVQNELYKRRFERLGIQAERIAVCGNIKADEAVGSLDGVPPPEEVLSLLRLPPQARKIVVLASSHEEDERVFIPAIPAQAQRFFFIIVPRHIERAGAIASRLQQAGVRFSLTSQLPDAGGAVDCLVFDRMGFLFPIMSIADIVFMGGTFSAATGGHNLYEPAALGKVIAGGPWYDNFPDIGRELEERGVYHRLSGCREWGEFLAAFPGVDPKRIGDSAREAVAARRGSLACSLEHIRRFLA
jgi:3-deoxy-D-manno-octulosonic-acid transferase